MGSDLHTDQKFVIGARREAVVDAEVTRTQIVQYAAASGDYSPLHTDEPWAQLSGYPSVMAHGMLTMAATETLLAEWVGRNRLVRYRARFVHPVWPGDALHAVATAVAVRSSAHGDEVDFEIRTTNHHGVVVLSGDATARV
ncbi:MULTISPECIES: MaoC family dehydratase [Mycobacteriaceae]|uniref:Dehydratase n=1 Tax=Mycolicibacterium gilvum TaxID=1804 RepID=A0A378SPY7_9MYCO|nr:MULTISPECIES: MaoC/PaaZ C-terminal domain-containing protein [Mycobacteriaceae]MCV7056143.1 MaoC family dehydratase N-terminal domain-containing protein [Mycolicibacterium gilvum]QEN16393.1 acyl dehydratase [Mycobacterium sp. ELW1]STZ44158.1 dehydratase [Mycolicibacterium gilvum]